ncbi:hypothetical protein FACS1894211_04360 [Clostridia bacterium]|nr:hypothetical protein FACS1894211_04360 [Clostridia bacterium]
MNYTDHKTDYGMLAYLKAEDLGKRMDTLSKKAYIGAPPRCTPIKYSKRLDKQLASYETFFIKPLRARGGAQGFTVLLKLKITNGADAEPDAEIILAPAMNGTFAAETVKILKGTHDYLLFGCGLAPEAGAEMMLTIDGAQGRTLVSYDLVFTGNDLQLEARKSTLKILWKEDLKSIVTYILARKAYYTLDLNGFGTYNDVDEFMALGGLFVRRRGRQIVILDANLVEKYAVSDNSLSFAVLYHAPEQVFYMTYTENGTAYFRELTANYMTMPVPVRLPFAAARCAAIPGAAFPAFLFYDGKGATYLKTAKSVAPELAQSLSVSVTLEVFDI